LRWIGRHRNALAAAAIGLAIGILIGLTVAPSKTPTPTAVASGQNSSPEATTPTGPSTGQATQSPHLTATRNVSYTGHGTRTLGTITLTHARTFRWTNTSHHFQIRFSTNQIAVNSNVHTGKLVAPPGTYTQVTIITTGTWTLTEA
jgi:hypothetical protein